MRILGLLLLDSFRMLRAQKLFWIFLVLSAVVSLLYASIGISETEFGILFGLWSFDLSEMLGGMEMTPDVAKGLYLWLFTDVIVRYWLGLIALVLGIISCASIFPEFVARGSVDLVLSKPPSRLLLYFGKYLGSLVFVAAQVFVFCLVVFFAFGLRYGDWNLSLFWALPVVLSIFSVIYSVHVFVSVWSGSVVFALLATVGVWGVGVLGEWSENLCYKMVYLMPQVGMSWDGRESGEMPTESAGTAGETIYGVINTARTVLPKTRVGPDQLRQLIQVGEGQDIADVMSGAEAEVPRAEAMSRFHRRHSIWKDVLSSLLFELLFLVGGAWVFLRRDY